MYLAPIVEGLKSMIGGFKLKMDSMASKGLKIYHPGELIHATHYGNEIFVHKDYKPRIMNYDGGEVDTNTARVLVHELGHAYEYFFGRNTDNEMYIIMNYENEFMYPIDNIWRISSWSSY